MANSKCLLSTDIYCLIKTLSQLYVVKLISILILGKAGTERLGNLIMAIQIVTSRCQDLDLYLDLVEAKILALNPSVMYLLYNEVTIHLREKSSRNNFYLFFIFVSSPSFIEQSRHNPLIYPLDTPYSHLLFFSWSFWIIWCIFWYFVIFSVDNLSRTIFLDNFTIIIHV